MQPLNILCFFASVFLIIGGHYAEGAFLLALAIGFPWTDRPQVTIPLFCGAVVLTPYFLSQHQYASAFACFAAVEAMYRRFCFAVEVAEAEVMIRARELQSAVTEIESAATPTEYEQTLAASRNKFLNHTDAAKQRASTWANALTVIRPVYWSLLVIFSFWGYWDNAPR